MFNPSGTPPLSPRKEASFFTSSDYRGGEARSLKASSSASSLVSPSKSRRIRALVKNLKIRTESSSSHGSTDNVHNSFGGVPSNMNESMHSPAPSPISKKPPTHSALNSRSNSVSSLGSRERSVERSTESSFGSRDYPTTHFRDKSLDKPPNMHYGSLSHVSELESHRTLFGRERSREREYPVMGARSLEREHSNLHRSKSIDQEYIATHSHYLPNQSNYIQTRETLVLDLQYQIADLNKECAILQQNLDLTKEKLSSSMNSIKTFWSPELKKERMLRKEENSKSIASSERLKCSQQEKEKLVVQLRETENQLRQLRDQSSPLQNGVGATDVSTVPSSDPSVTDRPRRNSYGKRDRQAKDIFLLRKTIEEMELRIETQKQTLSTRDESINKLLAMLKGKGQGQGVTLFEEQQTQLDKLRERTLADERRLQKLDKLLQQKDKEIEQLNEEVENFRIRERTSESLSAPEKRHSADLLTLEAMVETKDGCIASLEAEMEQLRREVEAYRTGSDSLLSTPDTGLSSSSQEAWSGASDKILKSKIDNLKAELGRKDVEVEGMKAQVASIQSQADDKAHLITVLREQIQAKEQQSSHIQHDLESLRDRLEEKEAQLELKSRSLLSFRDEHKRACTQVTELRGEMDMRERKGAMLLKQIEQLQEVIREKDQQLQTIQARLSALQTDRSSADSARDSLQTTIADQNRQTDKLKEKLERRECDHQEEVDLLQSTIRELKNKVSICENSIADRNRQISDLNQTNTDLGNEKTKKDSQLRDLKDDLHRQGQELRRLESELETKKQEINKLEEEVKQVAQLKDANIDLKKEKVRRDTYIKELKDELRNKVLELQQLHDKLKQTESRTALEGTEAQRRLQELEQELNELKREVQHRDGEVTRTQTEVDRLLDILRTTENEKNAKDKQIKDLNGQMKDYKQKIQGLKNSHQSEKSSQEQILEEARKNASEDTAQLKSLLTMKEERIEELEEALRESVKITAHREMVVHDLDLKAKKMEIQLKMKGLEMDELKEKSKEAGEEATQLRERLADKADELHQLTSEMNKRILDAFDMKQEAILAAITEKDAHIAVIEMTPSLPPSQSIPEVEKLTQQKHELQRKLKQLTEERMKVIMQEEKTKKNSTLSRKLSQKAKSRTSGNSTDT